MEVVRLDEGQPTGAGAHITVWQRPSSRSSHLPGNQIAEEAGEGQNRAASSGNLGNVG